MCRSFVWRDGALLPVPATKADVFRSRALSGGDKRSLMRFLSACVSAEQGQGHLKASRLAQLAFVVMSLHRKRAHSAPWAPCRRSLISSPA